VTLFSAWFAIGFALGAIAGTLATDLTRQEILQNEKFNYTLRFWQWSRQQSLAFVALLWTTLLFAAIISALWLGPRTWWQNLLPDDWWKDLLIGTIVGAVAAPWIWLHFVRHFGDGGNPELAGRDELITARAHQFWLEQGQPTGRADEHYATAKKELEAVEQRAVETSAKSAEQQLARYQLVSILFGAVLFVVMLLPFLHDWLGRTQQFQAFGVSLTLIAQRTDQGQGPVVGYNSGTDTNPGADRLLAATSDAYQIGAASLTKPFARMDAIGPDLKNFGNLSMIDRDRAFIAWLTYELPGDGPAAARLQVLAKATLGAYVEQAENLLKNTYHPAKWTDPSMDIAFAAGSTIISSCLHDYAAELHDPQLFTVDVGRFLRSFVYEVRAGPSSVQMGTPFDYSAYLGSSSELPNEGVGCEFDSIRRLKVDIPYQPHFSERFKVSPYPSLIAADFLAAIGAIDTGVLFIEDWIKDFKGRHDDFVPESEPQLGWYLLRAKLSAINLPYQFGGLTVPHRQLVSWQTDESAQFGSLLQVEGADGWKRLCSKLLRPTLHNNIGQWLALNYAMDRFYLFENLTPEDFDPRDPVTQRSLTGYLREAEAIRDNHACIERIPSYFAHRSEYTSYFNLYTAQLRLALLAGERNVTRRKSLIETIGQELEEADHFGAGKNTHTLLAPNDIWERHRVRLKLLRAQLENETRRDGQL
jgi:Protein of unknown function (DUF2934)